jgi:hypothetical protein
MAINVTTAFVDLFDSEVKQAYQAESVLRGTMRTRTGVAGNTVKFPTIGKGELRSAYHKPMLLHLTSHTAK